MYPLNRLRVIRSFELFLFGGVPDSAEQMYERETNPIAEIRFTRSTLNSDGPSQTDKGRVVEYIEFDPETGELTITDFSGR